MAVAPEMTQFVLPLDGVKDGEAREIILSKANRHIFAQFEEWRHWPFHTAILLGPPRSGKSLIARHFETKYSASVVDDAESLDPTHIFHCWNAAQQDGSPLLLVSCQTLANWRLVLPDLASRLASSQLLELDEPDDDMRSALAVEHLRRRGIALADHLTDYALARLDRSYRALEGFADTLDRLTLENRQPPTYKLVRKALAEIASEETG